MPRNEFFRQSRIQRNWRQSDIAQNLDVPVSTVQRWERGIHSPSAYYRAKLCDLFGLSLQELGLLDAPQSSQEEAEGKLQSSVSHPELAVQSSESVPKFELWTVPYVRNPHFIGRENYLQLIHLFSQTALELPMDQVGVPQAYALKGLGGIGKTQIVVEYAYRAREQKRYVHTLWITASSQEAILASFTALAELLPVLPSKSETNEKELVALVIKWLERCPQSWLLIVDNADDPLLVHPYLPRLGNGCILLTTRASAVNLFASSLEVDTMSIIEATTFLLHRADRNWTNLSATEREKANQLVMALGQFPLALDQAGAYIEETRCRFLTYFQLYQESRQRLLARRGTQITNYPESVATTWSLAFESIERINPAAAELLQLCAFCVPDSIPEELLTKGAPHWPPLLRETVTDLFRFNQILETLFTFSLVKRQIEDSSLSLHRLVQTIQMERMSASKQRQWVERLVCAVNTIFPSGKKAETWPQCRRYLTYVEVCSSLIEQWKLSSPEAGRLLHQAGIYANIHAQYAQAEQWLTQACAIHQQVQGTEHPQVAESLNSLAMLYQNLGRYEEAEVLFLRALSIGEHPLGSEYPDIASYLNNLGMMYGLRGRYEEAEPLFLRALSIGEHRLTSEHPDIAVYLNNLGMIYGLRGRYEEAEPLFLRALSIFEHQLGYEHPRVAGCLTDMAKVYGLRGKYEEAESLFLRALSIFEHQLGYEHPQVAECFDGLARLSTHQGKCKEAETLFQRALAIREQKLGHEHPDTVATLTGLMSLSPPLN